MKFIINLIFNVMFLIFVVNLIVNANKKKKKKIQKPVQFSQENEKVIKKYNEDLNNVKESIVKSLDRKNQMTNVEKGKDVVTLFSNVEKIKEREANEDLEEDLLYKDNSNDFDFGHIDGNEIIKGIVFSEILEKPKALRRLR